ncbi:MAG: hypothetical protein IPJ65_01810 [Archangiaceae bacterium]|nr:hypothetical protein [Archangiaceae bacterium]
MPTTTCPSGKQWVGGDAESSSMHPGVACITCHDRGEGPRFAAAGTVFTSFDAKDDCGGASTDGLTVILTDANGAEISLPVNAMGNFFLERRTLATPFSARVVDGAGKSRAMAARQTDGDCNACHSATGTQGAPGRIVAPE